jgi:divalent metal cation (Fe/Co/Zn/Cd) transporter
MNVNASRVAEGNAASDQSAEYRDAWFALRLSLLFGFLMLAAKTVAYFLTGSSAILADAAESVVHVIAIVFAAFSLRLSMRPATPNFLYGFEPIAFSRPGLRGP